MWTFLHPCRYGWIWSLCIYRFSDYHWCREVERILLLTGGFEPDNPVEGNDSTWGIFIDNYYTADVNFRIGSPLTKNKSIFFLNYHSDDQSLSSVHYWGCPMFGNFKEDKFVVTTFGLFHDWKMSGPHYNNYADSRVGSRHYPLIYHSKNSIKIIYVNSFN